MTKNCTKYFIQEKFDDEWDDTGYEFSSLEEAEQIVKILQKGPCHSEYRLLQRNYSVEEIVLN